MGNSTFFCTCASNYSQSTIFQHFPENRKTTNSTLGSFPLANFPPKSGLFHHRDRHSSSTHPTNKTHLFIGNCTNDNVDQKSIFTFQRKHSEHNTPGNGNERVSLEHSSSNPPAAVRFHFTGRGEVFWRIFCTQNRVSQCLWPISVGAAIGRNPPIDNRRRLTFDTCVVRTY